jgi:apolipoprotein N-acyltransferase
MRALTYVLALVATPLLYGLAFPPWRLAALAWIALAPWLVALRLASTTTRAVLIAGVTTLAASAVVAGWLPATPPDTVPPFALVWLVTVAPAVVLFTLCYRAAAARRDASIGFVAAAAWTGAEFARVELGVGVPFALLGYSQVPFPALVQIADVTGVYGISFAIVAANAALAELWLAAIGASRPWAAAGALATALGAVGLCLGYDALRAEPEADGPPQRVAVVQANVDLDEQTLADYLQLTREVLTPKRPALVVWPESGPTFLVEDEPRYREAIAGVLGPADVDLVTGGIRVDRGGRPRAHDAAFLLGPAGDVTAHYDKERLLPFVEFRPFDAPRFLERALGPARALAPGAPTPPLPTRIATVGVVVGNEVMLPRLVARRVAAGAQLLVHLSNDAWLGNSPLSLQLLDMARLRAIEQRRDLVHASASGRSAIIDASGDVVAATEARTRATLAGAIHPRAQRSFYGTVGDGFAISCAAVVVLELMSAVRRRRRRPPKPTAPATSDLPPRKKIGTP